LQPLIVEVHEGSNEKLYDVLASLYLKSGARAGEPIAVHRHLQKLAQKINEQGEPELINRLSGYTTALRKHRVTEAIYFPSVVASLKLFLVVHLIVKLVWFIAGGWLWRATRKLIFSKLRTDTFQGPTSLGAGMVLFPLVSLMVLIVLLVAGWPLWWLLIWWGVLALGKFIPEPVGLIWKMLLIPDATKRGWKYELRYFREKI
jgi:hypothetical protein